MTRLKEITVDPKTVKIAEKMDWSKGAAPSVNASGKWNVTADAGGQQIPITFNLKQDGSNFNGSLSSDLGGGSFENGKVSGKMLRGTARVEVQGQQMELKLEGTIEGDKMTGTLSGPGLPPITFTATKEK